jgi:hypothetical protein
VVLTARAELQKLEQELVMVRNKLDNIIIGLQTATKDKKLEKERLGKEIDNLKSLRLRARYILCVPFSYC